MEPLARQLAEANAMLAATKARMEALEASHRSLAATTRSLGSELRGTYRELDNIGGGMERAARQTRTFTQELERLDRTASGGGGRGGLASLFPGGARATGGVLAIGIGAAAAGIAPLLPALGVLAAAPAMLFTLVAALGAARLAFGGVSSAIDGNKKAYDALLPAQKAFVDTIRNDIYPLLNGLKETAAQNFFGPLTAAIQSVAANRGALANINGIVAELAKGMGQMLGSWVRFLGSTQMTQQLGQMFASWLHFWQQMTPVLQSAFQSFVQISNALAPLGTFLASAFAKGAKDIADWIAQAQKTGEFAKIISTIESSLKLLWSTVRTVANVFGALYTVLAPIGRVVLPDILSGLNFLAGLIRQNAALIDSDFLQAWDAVVTVVKTLAPLVGPLLKTILTVAGSAASAVDKLAHAFAGIKPLVEGIATVVNVAGKYILEAFLGPTTLIVANWNSMGGALANIATAIANAFISAINAILSAFESMANRIIDGYNQIFGWAFGNIGKLDYQIAHIQAGIQATAASAAQLASDQRNRRPMTAAERASLAGAIGAHIGGGSSTLPSAPTVDMKALGRSFQPPTFTPLPLSAFGGAPAFGGGGGGGGGGGAVPTTVKDALAAAEAADAQARASGSLRDQLASARNLAKVSEEILAHLKTQGLHGKALLQVENERKKAALDLLHAHKEIASIQKQLAQQAVTAKDYRLLGLDPAGQQVSPGVRTMRREYENIEKEIRSGGVHISRATQQELATLNAILKQKYIDPQVRQIVKQRLDDINSLIKTQLANEKQAFEQSFQQMTDAVLNNFDAQTQAHVDAMQTAMQNTLDAFDQMTADTVQKMQDDLQTQLDNLQIMVQSSAGSFLFGGDITDTPAERALKELQQIQQALDAAGNITVAAMELVRARAGGDPLSILQATLALHRAHVQQQEDVLQQQADIQRKAAEKQLAQARKALQDQGADAIKQYQIDRREQRKALSDQLADAITAYEKHRAEQRRTLVQELKDFEHYAETHRKSYLKLFGEHGDLMKIFGNFNINMQDLATNLGDNFIASLAKALGITAPGAGSRGPAPAAGGMPHKARGGPVQNMHAYIVGEEGPEVFIPGGNGTIMPHGAMGAVTYVDSRPIIVAVNGRQLMKVVRKEQILLGKRNVNIFDGLA